MLAITALLSLLANRLSAQEQLAALRGRDLRNQLEINRLVIAQMEQGVVVLDTTTRVRANNRSARVLLGLGADAQLTGRRVSEYAHLEPLAAAFVEWVRQAEDDGGWSDSVLAPVATASDSTRTMKELQLRVRFARPASPSSDEYVMFIEDIRVFEERAQHLKLAAMGRLAAIAHEIRNPLAAISHAGQLLEEAPDAALQARLVGIVRENTGRLKPARRGRVACGTARGAARRRVQLGPFVRSWLVEFLRDRDQPGHAVQLHAAEGLVVKFEQGHLRQVLFNLVDNALRYASKAGTACASSPSARPTRRGHRALGRRRRPGDFAASTWRAVRTVLHDPRARDGARSVPGARVLCGQWRGARSRGPARLRRTARGLRAAFRPRQRRQPRSARRQDTISTP